MTGSPKIVLLLVWLSLSSSHVFAEDVDPNRAQSDQFFRDGMRQIDQGDMRGACESFAASHKLVPRAGTLLNLGVCHAQIGELLVAWRELHEVLSVAKRANQVERAQTTIAHLHELEAQIGVIQVAPGADLARETAQVQIDGVTVPAANREKFAALPGVHVLELSAVGFEPREIRVSIGPGTKMTVEFPQLQPRAESAPAPTAAAARAAGAALAAPAAASSGRAPAMTLSAAQQRDDAERFDTPRTVALVSGITCVAAGLAFGAWAIERKGFVQDHCPNKACDQAGRDATDTGATVALVSTIAWAVGLAGFGVWVGLPGGLLNPASSTDRAVSLNVRGEF